MSDVRNPIPLPIPLSGDALADALIARLDPEYELIYIDRGDQLTNKQVDALVADDFETLWELLWEFESEAREYGIKYEMGELLGNIKSEFARMYDPNDEPYLAFVELVEGFESTNAYERVREEIIERDKGTWFSDLVSATPDVLLRIGIDALGEDAGLSFREVTAAEVLDLVGFAHTEHNLRVVQYALSNASPEYSVIMGYWVVGADLGEISRLVGDKPVQITDPHLYLGNPFSGSGWVTDEALEGTVVVERADLRTDAAAFGYGINDIYGGVNASSFSATIATAKRTQELSK